jgi:hypothetical protein
MNRNGKRPLSNGKGRWALTAWRAAKGMENLGRLPTAFWP